MQPTTRIKNVEDGKRFRNCLALLAVLGLLQFFGCAESADKAAPQPASADANSNEYASINSANARPQTSQSNTLPQNREPNSNAGGDSNPEPAGNPSAGTSQPNLPSAAPPTDEQSSSQTPGEPLVWGDASSFDADGKRLGFYPRRTFAADLLEEYGIRHLSGPRLDLYTDIAANPGLDQLPEIFEFAHRAWCEYFAIGPEEDSAWRMNGFVMADRQKFIDSGLLPEDIPAFDNAYCRDFEFWMDDKSTDYYRHHLALHEGTHGFMLTHISGNYPEWYFEGMAECLGTHRLTEDAVLLGYYPQTSAEVPMWGRVGLVREGYRGGRLFPWKKIFTDGIPPLETETEFYAWVWAWSAFMNGMPAYEPRFHELYKLRHQPDFSTALARQYSTEWAEINDNWQVFVSEIDYAYDFERNAIQFAPGEPVAGETDIEILADRGWQSTGLQLEAGATYEVEATGRYVMHRDDSTRPATTWESEPPGITIQYFNGLPVGMLQAVLVPDERDPAFTSAFLNAVSLGRGGEDKAATTGTLYLRINDHPAQRGDNSGSAKVTVRKVSAD